MEAAKCSYSPSNTPHNDYETKILGWPLINLR